MQVSSRLTADAWVNGLIDSCGVSLDHSGNATAMQATYPVCSPYSVYSGSGSNGEVWATCNPQYTMQFDARGWHKGTTQLCSLATLNKYGDRR